MPDHMTEREKAVLDALEAMGADRIEHRTLARAIDLPENTGRSAVVCGFVAALCLVIWLSFVDPGMSASILFLLPWSVVSSPALTTMIWRRIKPKVQAFPGDLDLATLTPRQIRKALRRAKRKAEREAKTLRQIRAIGGVTKPASEGALSVVEGGARPRTGERS